MAEVVGIIAASGQFLEQSLKIYSLSKKLLDQINDAPKEIEEWRDELQGLQKLVAAIETSPALQTDDLEPIVNQCKSVANVLSDILAQIEFSSTDSFGHKTWKAIGGLAKEAEIRDLFGQIERLKSTLGDRIAVINLNQGHDGFARLETVMQDLKRFFQSGTPEEQCLQALFVTDPISDREGIITSKGKRTKGTCEWVLKRPKYQDWNAAPSGLLWICGAPGKGKTILSVFLTQILEATRADATVIWFFCDNKVASRNTAVNILRGLMIQLILRHQHLISHLLPTWKIQGGDLFGVNSFESLWGIFLAMLESLVGTEICCVLDALDECDEQSLSPLVSKLVALFNDGGSGQRHSLKLIVASREQPQCLSVGLSAFPHIRLDMMDHDIDLYISDRVAHLARMKAVDTSPLRLHIYEAFQNHAGGTFLWVSFMSKDLEQKSLGEIEWALTQLPSGLDAIYERILAQIKPENKQVVSEILTWLSLATRPLRVVELCEAVNIKPTQHLTREQVCLGHVQSCGHLLLLSHGRILSSKVRRWLLDLQPELLPLEPNSKDGFFDSLDPNVFIYVSFMHQSAKDFLLGNSQSSPALQVVADKKKAHARVATRLVSCLSTGPATGEQLWCDLDVQVPLLAYAVENWTHHMRKAEDQGIAVIKENKGFFSRTSKSRDKWWLQISWMKQEHGFKDVSLLHVAGREGLYHLAKHLLQEEKGLPRLWRGLEINKRWGIFKYAPLHYAAQQGWEDIAELFLKCDADAAIGDLWGSTPLHTAVKGQSHRLFHLLASTKGGKKIIEAESKSQTVEDARCSLLHLAATAGDTHMCGKLIENHHLNVDILSIPKNCTPLARAISSRHLDLARQLVERWGAKATPEIALLRAVTGPDRGSEKEDPMFQEALELVTRDLGVNINTEDQHGNAFLHQPVPLKIEQVKEFITRGFDLSKCNNKGETMLHSNYHLSNSHELASLFLKESQLDINTRDSEGRTALHSFIKVVDLEDWDVIWRHQPNNLIVLLDLGADRSLRDAKGKTASELPAKYRDKKIPLTSGSRHFWSQVIETLASYTTVPVNGHKVK
ncbi:ankyrin repeat [Fusarium albosuccineum]|uniref:Ankyrin repeat n=1 Tax=Fusarium albosuccineum TaxID=1237068 RepID=A0A8H4KIW1_9HYPO|nr:ankyrin repeat [Fusarium albosuccineum]